MFWLLLIVLFQADPAQLPDTVSHAFATQAQCEAAAQQMGTSLAKDNDGYGAAGLKCEAVSDPRTARSASSDKGV